MSIITPLQFEPSSEMSALRVEIEIKDQQLKLYELRREISAMSQSPAKRNLSLEVAKLEIQRLQNKIAHLESRIDEKDIELIQIKLERSGLLKELNENKEFQSSTLVKNEMVDNVLTVMRAAKEELVETQKALESVKIQKESSELKQTRAEYERDQLKRDNEMLVEEMKNLRKETDAQTARLRKRIDDCVKDYRNLKKEHQWAVRSHEWAVQKDQEIIDELEDELEEERKKNEQLKNERKATQVPPYSDELTI